MPKYKRILKSLGRGDDYVVLVREENGVKYVATESYLKKNPDFQGTNIGSFLAHSPYWEEI
ncbi:hypothetical protein AWQ21_15000 (plasmid) [Picosynechococcus sp. PCC 7003]|nr:hypothetical protein AWQ21_15000 [Picosynechococcus sp. PCC 7003]